MRRIMLVLISTAIVEFVAGQDRGLFNDLPLGKYGVGFRIFSLVDSSRMIKSPYNYFGEKETGDLYARITVHVWYPAIFDTKSRTLTYGDYCYQHLLKTSHDTISTDRKTAAMVNMRETFQGFFGKITEENWNQLKNTRLLAQKEATPVQEKFPLLIGMLRPLSTSVTNEMMASNGYIVAMVVNTGFRYPLGYISDVTDMRIAMTHILKSRSADKDKVGAYGFSGAGFSQVLLTMNDPRIKAVADIESALYGEGIADIFFSSNLYNAANLRVPFLHIYGKDLGNSDTEFRKFHEKKYSQRYHLLLNYQGLHHWDVASEGRASTTVLHIRGEKEADIRATFELANKYLLNFFDAVLKKSADAERKLGNKGLMGNYHDSLWTFRLYPALPPPPDRIQFETIVNRNGIDSAIRLARKFFAVDTAVEFLHQNSLNALARQFRSQNRPAEGLALMSLAVEFHPREAWLWNNLADMHDNSGNKRDAMVASEKVLELLKDFKGSEQSFNERIRRSSMARLERLRRTN